MGRAFEVIGFNTVNPGAAFAAAAAAVGDSLVVRSFPFQSAAYLEDLWSNQATAGAVRVRSPRLHDNVNGLRFNVLAATPVALLPDWLEQGLEPQDTLIVEQTGGAAETEVGAMLVTYDDLPGIEARMAMWSDIKGRIKNYVGALVAPTSSATIGAWGPGRAINADVDNLKANVDYAVLGYDVDVNVTAVTIRGVDTGNLRVGGPGSNNRVETRDWFIRQADRSQRPLIPIINAANKGGILVDVLNNAASTTVNINWVLAELSS